MQIFLLQSSRASQKEIKEGGEGRYFLRTRQAGRHVAAQGSEALRLPTWQGPPRAILRSASDSPSFAPTCALMRIASELTVADRADTEKQYHP